MFADACEFLKRHSVHVYLWRFKDAPPEIASTAGNTVPLLVNLNESAGVLEACTTLIQEWLIALGPGSGAHLGAIWDFATNCWEQCPSQLDAADLPLSDKCLFVAKRALQGAQHPALHDVNDLGEVVPCDQHATEQSSEDEQMQSPSHSVQANSTASSISSPSSTSEEHAQDCDDDIDELVPLLLHPVLSSIGADFIGRSKLTLWQMPGATYNGGWCMCVKSGKTEVSPRMRYC